MCKEKESEAAIIDVLAEDDVKNTAGWTEKRIFWKVKWPGCGNRMDTKERRVRDCNQHPRLCRESGNQKEDDSWFGREDMSAENDSGTFRQGRLTDGDTQSSDSV